jgi:hypothetical protein
MVKNMRRKCWADKIKSSCSNDETTALVLENHYFILFFNYRYIHHCFINF